MKVKDKNSKWHKLHSKVIRFEIMDEEKKKKQRKKKKKIKKDKNMKNKRE